jgi:hypothetical protein
MQIGLAFVHFKQPINSSGFLVEGYYVSYDRASLFERIYRDEPLILLHQKVQFLKVLWPVCLNANGLSVAYDCNQIDVVAI